MREEKKLLQFLVRSVYALGAMAEDSCCLQVRVKICLYGNSLIWRNAGRVIGPLIKIPFERRGKKDFSPRWNDTAAIAESV
jgi:hypothetical protein